VAFERADPRPFAPPTLPPLDIDRGDRTVRVVATRCPRCRHENFAIATIDDGMPNNLQVDFEVIRESLEEFLVQHKHLSIRSIQPTHLGQAYVAFEYVFDKDNLVQNSPHHYDGISIFFVNYNQDRNWKSFTFNRECWLMFLGFPLDYWEEEYNQQLLGDYGRVLSWEMEEDKRARLIVKAHVIDLDKIPQWIIFSDGDDFQGES
jgi:hypothetical protein